MTRHEWRNIHFYFALFFLTLMVVHILLHWSWIKGYFKSLLGMRRKTSGQTWIFLDSVSPKRIIGLF
jgi:hypothetical protein